MPPAVERGVDQGLHIAESLDLDGINREAVIRTILGEKNQGNIFGR
jgi:hypothetical protein